MAFNLLDLLKDQVTGSLASQAANFLGGDASEEKVSSALDGIFPSLLGSMIDKAGSTEGASGLMNMVNMVDSDLIGNIGNLFGGGEEKVNGILNSGGGMIESLLGDKVGGVIGMISKLSGLGKNNSSSLLSMAAPFLMSMLSKKIGNGGASGLVDLLMGQKDNVASALPSGMGSILGLSGLTNLGKDALDSAKDVANDVTDTAKNVGNTATNVARDAGAMTTKTASSGLGFLKWLLPFALIAILGYLLATRGCGGTVDEIKDTTSTAVDKTKEVSGDVVDKTGDMMKATADMAKAAFGKVDASAKAALGSISFAANSAGKQMMDFVEGEKTDPRFVFNNLTFETGSARIDAASAKEVDNVAAVLKAYPDVKIELGGHTDNTGDAAANKTLSKNRAEAVKARLIAKGIAGNRIITKGYGQEDPIASNDTEEGRSENRRIEITVVK